MKRFALLLAAFLLAGCAAAPAQPAPAATERRVFNDTDVMFSQMMVAHHSQALNEGGKSAVSPLNLCETEGRRKSASSAMRTNAGA